MAQFSSWLRRRTACLRSRCGTGAACGVIVGLRLLWIHLQRPAHLEENAAAVWFDPEFLRPGPAKPRWQPVHLRGHRGRPGPCPVSVRRRDGEKRQILTDKARGGILEVMISISKPARGRRTTAIFSVCVSNRLMVCSADTNQAKAVIEDKPFSEAVWLTPTLFAYMTEETNLCVAQKQEDGQWERNIIVSRNVPVTSLTAIGSDTVAWLENGEVICRANVSERSGATACRIRTCDSRGGGAAHKRSYRQTVWRCGWTHRSCGRRTNRRSLICRI